MSSTGIQDSQAAPVNDSSQTRPRQVAPLPVGPGGGNQTKQQLNDTNTQLTMMKAQSTANTKYDPPVPQPVTKPVIKENFTNHMIPSSLMIIGGLLLVYGLIGK